MKENNLPANFLISLQSGHLKIKTDNNPSINFTATKNTRIIDIIDIPIKISGKPGIVKQLSKAKELARELKQRKITLEIRLQGEAVLKLGEKANPKLAKIVTLSNNIEITDLKKLKKLSDAI